MQDSQDFNQRNKLKPITSIGQLVSSKIVTDAIMMIRESREEDFKKKAKDRLPKLSVDNKELVEVYERFSEMVNFKLGLLLIAKKALEDMHNYSFKEDPSINRGASIDTEHLKQEFSTSYTLLERVNLFDHTLNVFKIGLDEADKQGRAMQSATPLLGALLHDFGKSSKIREMLLGHDVGDVYKKHADVSKMYVEDILLREFPAAESILDIVSLLVSNHHPSNNKMKKNDDIKFIIYADFEARKREMRILKEN